MLLRMNLYMYTLWVYQSKMYNSYIKTYTAKEDYDVVFTIVKEKYSAGWHTIASHLDINKHEFDNINSDHRLKCEECKSELVDV